MDSDPDEPGIPWSTSDGVTKTGAARRFRNSTTAHCNPNDTSRERLHRFRSGRNSANIGRPHLIVLYIPTLRLLIWTKTGRTCEPDGGVYSTPAAFIPHRWTPAVPTGPPPQAVNGDRGCGYQGFRRTPASNAASRRHTAPIRQAYDHGWQPSFPAPPAAEKR